MIHGEQWPWRQSLQTPGCRYAHLIAQSQTFGEVMVLIVDEPGEDRIYLLCRQSTYRQRVCYVLGNAVIGLSTSSGP